MKRMKNLLVFQSKSKNNRRYFLNYSIGGNPMRAIEAKLETAWHPKQMNPGFRFHVGDRGSETPIDVAVDLGPTAFYFSLNFPHLGAICERIARSHKRNISLQIHGDSLWWELWYDDDMGNDAYHKCDAWRKPKLWPWSLGRRKYRSWMCLRQGSIDLNPLDAFWGRRLYHYEDIQKKRVRVPVRQFPGDEYVVDFTLQRQTRSRNFGPKWIRHETDEGFCADWSCKEGIPVQNHEWKGDEIFGSAEPIPSVDGKPVHWVSEACLSLVKRVERDRERYGYQPPKPKLSLVKDDN